MPTLRMALQWLWQLTDSRTRRLGLLVIALVVLGSALAVLVPIALKLAIDAMQAGRRDSSSLPMSAWILSYVLGLYLIRVVAELRNLAQGRVEQRLQRQLSVSAFEHLLHLPMSFHIRSRPGATVDTVEQGLRGYAMLLQPAIGTVLPAALDLIAVSVVLVQFAHPEYLIVIACALAAYVWAVCRRSLGIVEPANAVIASHVQASAALAEALVNVESVKAFGASRAISDHYGSISTALEQAWRRFFSRRARSSVVLSTIGLAALGGSLVLAAYQVERRTLTLGDLVLVHAYILQLLQPLELVSYAIRDAGQGLAGVRSLLSLMEQPDERRLQNGARDPRSSSPALEFDRVTFAYAQGAQALHEVTFSVPPGRTVAVVGASGSGKSTLIRLLLRLYEPDAGEIRLGGTPIAEMDVTLLRRFVALVPQDTTLLHDTLANNIAFGSPQASRTDIEAAARVAGLHPLIASLPEGYDTLAGERGLRFSSGERQRIAIARAVLKQAPVILFDEATSSLDSRTERLVLRNLASLSAGRTTLVIAHRLATITHADSIVVLQEGRVVESGSHEELLRRDGHYAALWTAQHARSATGP